MILPPSQVAGMNLQEELCNGSSTVLDTVSARQISEGVRDDGGEAVGPPSSARGAALTRSVGWKRAN